MIFDAVNICDLRKQLGDRGKTALSADAIGQKGQKKLSEENWVLRRFLLTLAENKLLEYPLNLERSEAPDFYWTQGRSERAPLEVTRATSSVDLHERSRANASRGSTCFGEFGGRPAGDAFGNSAAFVAEDVAFVVLQKRSKAYASRMTLVIYLDGNPAVFTDFNGIVDAVKDKLAALPLQFEVAILSANGKRLAVDLAGQPRIFSTTEKS